MTATAAKPRSATTPLRLYEIGEALEIARDWLVEPDNQQKLLEAEGDLDALPELKELLEGVELDFNIKAENVAIMAREFGLSADMTKLEIERLTKIRKAYEASATGLKAYLRVWFLKLNIKKVEGTRAKPRIQANNPAVKCTIDPEELSRMYAIGLDQFVTKITKPAEYVVDTARVLAAWKDAEVIVGKCPEIGTPDYPQLRADWDAAMDTALRELGVPAGITVERGTHVRIG